VNTTYLVDTANPTGYPQVMEDLVNGVVQRVYTYGVPRISQSQVISGAWAASFYGYDGQGSVRFLSGSTGAVTDHYTYDAFGNQLAAVGATPNVNRYAGEAFDAALQMTYLRARYMNPGSGRFWTADTAQGNPFDPPSLHRYLYAAADPVNEFDPLGLFSMFQGTLVHQWIGANFLADGLAKALYGRFAGDRLSGTGKGGVSLGKLLFGRAWSPALYGFTGSRRFPDLIDIGAHIIFEITTSRERAQGVKAMNDYLSLANANDPALTNGLGTYQWRAGTAADFNPFPVVPCDTTDTCFAFVHKPDPNGVITYDEVDLKPVLYTLAIVGEMAIMMAPLDLALAAPFIVALSDLAITVAEAQVLFAAGSEAETVLGNLLLN